MNEVHAPAVCVLSLCAAAGPPETGPAVANCATSQALPTFPALCASVSTTAARNADPPICSGHIDRSIRPRMSGPATETTSKGLLVSSKMSQ